MADVERRNGGPRSAIVVGVDPGIPLRIATGCAQHAAAGIGPSTASTVHPP